MDARRISIAAAVGAVALLTGCGDDGGGDSAEAEAIRAGLEQIGIDVVGEDRFGVELVDECVFLSDAGVDAVSEQLDLDESEPSGSVLQEPDSVEADCLLGDEVRVRVIAAHRDEPTSVDEVGPLFEERSEDDLEFSVDVVDVDGLPGGKAYVVEGNGEVIRVGWLVDGSEVAFATFGDLDRDVLLAALPDLVDAVAEHLG